MANLKPKPKKKKIENGCGEFIQEKISESGVMMALTKASMGDFSGKVKTLEKDDELNELITAIQLTIIEMQALEKERKIAEKAKEVSEAEKIHILSKSKKELEKKVQERTQELQKRVAELERFQNLVVGRELKMVELKQEVERFKKRENK